MEPRDIVDIIIIIIIVIGLIWAALRFRQDMTRPLENDQEE